MTTLEKIADDFTTAIIRDARANGLKMKDIKLPEFQGSVAMLRDQVTDWLDKHMELDLPAVANGRAE